MATVLSVSLLLPLLLLLPLAGNLPAVVVGKPHIEGPPGPEMMMVDLRDYGSGVGTLAVRMDGLSVAGFANRSGHWHALRGNEHLFRVAAATPLPFGSSYGDLVGGVKNLPDLPLEEDPATVVISAYDPAAAADDDDDEVELKRALATLTVVICETQRLRPVMDTVLATGGRRRGAARVAAEHLPYIEHWDAMWDELKRWRRTAEWGGGPFAGELRERAKIGSAKEALAVIGWTFRHILLRRDGSMPERRTEDVPRYGTFV
uniref:rRNA N-glycosylase n=2 Tax=Oryza TaxID=4527 RepID=A0A0E0GRX7_ORYNI